MRFYQYYEGFLIVLCRSHKQHDLISSLSILGFQTQIKKEKLILTLCRVTVCCSHITVSSIAALCIERNKKKKQKEKDE